MKQAIESKIAAKLLEKKALKEIQLLKTIEEERNEEESKSKDGGEIKSAYDRDSLNADLSSIRLDSVQSEASVVS